MTTTRSASPRRNAAGRWYFVVDLGPGPDGGRRQARRRGFATKREAQEAMDRLRTSAREGTFVEPTKLSVTAYLDAWLEGLPTAGRRPATVANYRWVVRCYVVPALGGVRLQALQPTQLDSLYASLGARGLSARTRALDALSHPQGPVRRRAQGPGRAQRGRAGRPALSQERPGS